MNPDRTVPKIGFRKAETSDAELLIDIYNAAFYSDYIRYGECPAYGRTKEKMEQSIIDYPRHLIIADGRPVGCISCKETENGVYEVGCLCVIPECQGRGIGTAAMEFAKSYYTGWKELTLVTPADKSENVRISFSAHDFDYLKEHYPDWTSSFVKKGRFTNRRTEPSCTACAGKPTEGNHYAMIEAAPISFEICDDQRMGFGGDTDEHCNKRGRRETRYFLRKHIAKHKAGNYLLQQLSKSCRFTVTCIGAARVVCRTE